MVRMATLADFDGLHGRQRLSGPPRYPNGRSPAPKSPN